MALDGMMLSLLRTELDNALVGARVEKIYQPSREELILSLRGFGVGGKLMLSAKAVAPRAHLTAISVENPKQPPMFCMLLRKTIGAAKLIAIRQPGFERVLLFDFDTVNEFGDPVVITLIAEIMGRHSNLILVGADGRIIDSVKRIGLDKSSVRQILPGLSYAPPPPQERVAVTQGAQAVLSALDASPRDLELSKLLQETLEGASPLVCRELAYACGAEQTIRSELSLTQRNALLAALDSLLHTMNSGEITPIMLLTPEPERQPKDFSFLPIAQYGDAMETRVYPSLSALLDAFYGERDAVDRMKQKMSDFSRLVQSRIERVQRKLCAQKEELLACQNRDQLRQTGDLLSSNLHQIAKGMSSITVEDYYHPDSGSVTVALDIRLTPSQNVQHYYKEYRRADTAEKMLVGLIAEGERELEYLDTVWDEMTRARSEAELSLIRSELAESGYLRAAPGAKRKQEPKLKPLCYRSSDGFLILSGRNNVQNERLTLKDSRNNDLWFHTQKIAGAHTVVLTEGRPVPERTLTEAAIIAAVNSKARASRKVPVDYTLIKNVKKQPGGRPGMVIYVEYQTAIVDPDEALVQTLIGAE